MKKRLLALLLAAVPLIASAAGNMRLMSVQDLSELAVRGKGGEVAATAYVQGAVEGMLAMDSMQAERGGGAPRFCGFFAAYKKGIDHPASVAILMIQQWEQEKMDMAKPAMEMVQMYMQARFGQGCNEQQQ